MNLWHKQSTLNVPSPSEAMKRPQILESEKLTQFGQARRFSAHSENLGAPSVARLDDGVRPTNISDDISKIVVDAVKFVFRWAFPKVGKERFERVAPSLANRNAPSAVVVILAGFGIFASLNHLAIGFVCSGIIPFSGVSVDGDAFDWEIARPAGGRAATLKAGVPYQFFRAAFASTNASSENRSAFCAMRWAVRDDCELAECSSDEGFSLGHNDGSFIVVSSGGSRLQPILAAFSTVNQGGLNA